MKIFYAQSNYNKNVSEKVTWRTLQLTTLFNKLSSHLGILQVNAENPNNRLTGVSYLDKISDIDEMEWDIFIVQDNRTLKQLKEKVRSKPVVFIAHENNIDSQCAVFPNLLKIIATDPQINPIDWGIAEELVRIIPIPFYQYNNTKQRVAGRHRLLYVINERDIDLKTSRTVIKAINNIPTIDLTIVCSEEIIDLLENIANTHISFKKKKISRTIDFNNYNLILAEREIAQAAALNGIFAIVLEANGLRGLLHDENLEEFIQTNNRKEGDEVYKSITVKAIEEEIRNSIESIVSGRVSLLKVSSLKIKHGLTINWKKQFKDELTKSVRLFQYLQNKESMIRLVPKIANNVYFKNYGGDQVAIIDNNSGKLIGSIGQEELHLVSYCTGKINMGTVINENKQSQSNDIISLLINLYENKLLNLSLPK